MIGRGGFTSCCTAATLGQSLSPAGQASRVVGRYMAKINKVVRVSLAGVAQERLQAAVQRENAQGWQVAGVLPERSDAGIGQRALRALTLFLWQPQGACLLILEKDVAEGEAAAVVPMTAPGLTATRRGPAAVPGLRAVVKTDLRPTR